MIAMITTSGMSGIIVRSSQSLASCRLPSVLQATRTQRKNARIAWLAMACCGVSLAAVGCGRPGPSVQPVEGTILLDGQPLEGATVGFSPTSSEGGLPAVGLTDSEGRFTLTSTGGGRPEAGAVIGDYAVVVSKQEVEGTGPTPEAPAMAAPPPTAYPQQPKVINVVPLPYGRSEASGLRATVKSGRNVVRFELESTFQGK
jgi:hypothetical protein